LETSPPPPQNKINPPRRYLSVGGFTLLKPELPDLKIEPELKEFRQMKKSKISLVAVLALSLTLGLAASSWARPGGGMMGGMGGGMGCGMMGAANLTPEQAGKFFDLKEKFHDDTAATRKQMMVKRAELAALWKAEKPDQAAINAKQKEINALRDQMQEARKISPELGQGFGRGMHGGKGGGRGMGPGGGMGPGPMGSGGPGAGAPAPAPPAK
jgi:Spy/CpxP family protein refolding chaperone